MARASDATRLQQVLRLTSHPIAIGFLAIPPPGVSRIASPAAAGCGYWSEASSGRAFFTTAEDHHGCPVGAYTHGIAMPPNRAAEFDGTIGTMLSLEYLKSEELPLIPRRTEPANVIAYAPLAEASFEPDVILVRGTARQIMLLSEAARSAGCFSEGATMGRPACAMVAATQSQGSGLTSLGCIGNRVYTGLRDDELYFALPATKLDEVLSKVERIVSANETLEQYHRQKFAAAQSAQGINA
jgi:uncharacterized protein (DUF169 family)